MATKKIMKIKLRAPWRPAPRAERPLEPRPAARLAGLAGILALVAGCSTASLDPGDLGLSDFSGASPSQYPVHGIDLSKYQGDIDWVAARDGGVAFAWLKATEGSDRVDSGFARNWRAAGAAGVPRGAYHFFYLCGSGLTQAKWFIANVPRDAVALPPVLDVEWTPDSPTCTKRPPREELIGEMKAFMDAVEAHYGMRPIVYAPIDVHRDRLVGAFPTRDFWLRAVKDHPDNVYTARPFRFWQYTATGTVPGVSGDVDRNAFSGSKADWVKWLRANRPR